MEAKTCVVCGKEFTSRYQWQKCCSHECSGIRKRELSKERARKYRQEHKEECRESCRRYYWRHVEYLREYHRVYYWEHREERLAYSREYYLRNRERFHEYYKKRRKGKLDLAGVIEAADEKPEKCPFEGPCLECPYPDCVVE